MEKYIRLGELTDTESKNRYIRPQSIGDIKSGEKSRKLHLIKAYYGVKNIPLPLIRD